MVYSPITQPASLIEEGSKLLDPFVLNVPLCFSIGYDVSVLFFFFHVVLLNQCLLSQAGVLYITPS